MSITVDTNAGEDAVYMSLCSMPDLQGKVERGRLDLGDVRLTRADGSSLLVERKTWADWAASIQDGRYKEQKARAIASADGSTRYIYLLEDSTGRPFDGHTRGMNNASMHAAAIKTQLRDGIAVLHALNPHDTALHIAYVFRQFTKGGVDPGASVAPPGYGGGGGGPSRKRQYLDDKPTLLTHMLSVIPGVSSAKARVIVQHYDSLASLALASVDDIANLPVDSSAPHNGVKRTRRMGKAIAGRIKGLFR